MNSLSRNTTRLQQTKWTTNTHVQVPSAHREGAELSCKPEARAALVDPDPVGQVKSLVKSLVNHWLNEPLVKLLVTGNWIPKASALETASGLLLEVAAGRIGRSTGALGVRGTKKQHSGLGAGHCKILGVLNLQNLLHYSRI